VGRQRLRRAARAGLWRELKRSALQADCPAMLGPMARRRTRCVRCANSARTVAASRTAKRTAHAAV